MAEVKAPLMSMAASGRYSDELVFFQRNGKQLVRKYVRHSGGDSNALKVNRNIFREAARLSKMLTKVDRWAWNKMTGDLPINGHNLFMKKAMETLYSGQDFQPVYGLEVFIFPGRQGDDSKMIKVTFTGQADTDYNVLVGEGSYIDWTGGDPYAEGNYGRLIMLEEARTDADGNGGFVIDGLDWEGSYWFRLEEIGGGGFSGAYHITWGQS